MLRPPDQWQEKVNKLTTNPKNKVTRLMAHWKTKAKKNIYSDQVERQVKDFMHSEKVTTPSKFHPYSRAPSPEYIEIQQQPKRNMRPVMHRPLMRTTSFNGYDGVRFSKAPLNQNRYPTLPSNDPTRTHQEQVIYDTVKTQIDKNIATLHQEVTQVDDLIQNYRNQQINTHGFTSLPPMTRLSSLPLFHRQQPSQSQTNRTPTQNTDLLFETAIPPSN